MRTIPKRGSERTLERAVKYLLVAVVLTTIAMAAYYINDRYRHPNVPLLDRRMQAFEEMVRRDPESTAARIAVADVYVSKQMYDQAIFQYGEALKLGDDDQSALLGLGTAYMAKGDTARMVEHFDRLVTMLEGSDFAHADRRLQIAYYHLGRVYLEQGNYDLAIERLEQATLINRTDADALYLLGNAFQGKGEYEEAVVAYRAAVTFVPNFVEAYQGMAQAYEKQGDTARAGYPRAMVAFWSGDKAGALRQLEAAAAQVSDEDIFTALGLVREDAGLKQQAIEAFRQALALNPAHGHAKEGLRRLGASDQAN